MSTISSIAQNTYTMYKMAEGDTAAAKKASTSASSTSSASSKKVMTAEESNAAVASAAESRNAAIAAAQTKVANLSNLVSSFSGAYSTSSTKNTASSFSRLWSGYASALSGLQGIRSVTSGAASLVQSYTDTQKTFAAQYGSTMNDLKDAAKTVSQMKFDFSAADITTGSDGTQTYSDNLKSAIANVKSLVTAYNDALGVTSDYKSVGTRMASLSTAFADTTYRADTYKQYGISVDSKTGALTLDESKLATALTTNSAGAEAALGKNGLAGKAADHASFALSQQNKVFPSMQDMLGGQLAKASAYTNPRVLTSSMNASMLGSLIDSMF